MIIVAVDRTRRASVPPSWRALTNLIVLILRHAVPTASGFIAWTERPVIDVMQPRYHIADTGQKHRKFQRTLHFDRAGLRPSSSLPRTTTRP